ncbi:hypothetical protein L0128_11750 [candidate division KSB1 bacterium]|nr:hypothetical protein [candidate division KSB1 bacterium]
MKHAKTITILVILMLLVAAGATLLGIFSNHGAGPFEYKSIRGQTITIYGRGIYQHMSADVAIQGIAQDYITLLVGLPLLGIALIFARKNSLRGRLLLSGTVLYFLLTYLFYLAMAMYNVMFPGYVFLLSAAFFTFILIFFSYPFDRLKDLFRAEKWFRMAGLFLMVDSVLVALLWFSTILPPLFDGSIIPAQVQHYTTLIVQGFDLALFLPLGFVAGLLAYKQHPYGYLCTTIYVIFLSLLMTALSSKIMFMAQAGANVIPVVFIMPTINVLAILFSISLLRRVKNNISVTGKP